MIAFMTWVEVVRGCGALLGIFGALIAAPGAPSKFADTWQALRSRRRDADVHPGTVHGAVSFGGTLEVSVSGIAWAPDAPVEEQIERLRVRADETDASIRALRSDNDLAHRELTDQLTRSRSEIYAEITALHDDLRSRDDVASQVDAAGFEVIAVSFVLTGMPATWVRHWWVAVLLLVLAAVVIALGVGHLIRSRRRRAAVGSHARSVVGSGG